MPTRLIDRMRCTGTKDSGLRGEGLRYAIEDVTEIRIVVLPHPG